MLHWTRRIVRLLEIGTWAVVAFFAVMAILLSLNLWPAPARAALPGHEAAMKQLLGALLVVGIGMGAAVIVVFRRLVAIIDTVIAGHPFTPENGERLRAMAWALLAVQLIDLALAWVEGGINRNALHAAFRWNPSVTGWIAVLLLFALAQVFTTGARMQDDLEGTV